MKLYLVSQEDNQGYDTFDSCLVYAKDETDAKTIHPDGKELEVKRTTLPIGQ
ncbi:hypothetical protein N9043_00160 [bacterium]|nr:hypothetical protein [bacterium]